ncbi:MAG: hypothetical protein RIQ99_1997 [Pseudomonadota bacterium]|jgi:ABC-type nitrate/sulfonate/bicarbonate transport system substrate-binding protein
MGQAPSPRSTIAALAALGMATSAAAQSAAPATTASRDLPVTGSAPQVCALQDGQIQPGGLINIAGTSGASLQIEQFVDPQTLAARAASATVDFTAVCNFPHTMRIESQGNGLWPTDGRISGPLQGFAYAVPYTAVVNWGGSNATLTADGKVRQIVQQSFAIDQPAQGTLSLRVEIAEGASNVENRAPVMAGAYADTLRIFLEPR